MGIVNIVQFIPVIKPMTEAIPAISAEMVTRFAIARIAITKKAVVLPVF